MRPLIVVVAQPLVEIGLQRLHRFVEMLAELDSEELLLDRQVEALHKTICLLPPHFGPPVLEIDQGEIELVGMRFSSVELAAIVGQHGLHRQALLGIEGEHIIVEHTHGDLGLLGSGQEAKGETPKVVDYRVQVGLTDLFQIANVEGVLTQQLAGPGGFDVPLLETGIELLDVANLFGRELHAFIQLSVFEGEPALELGAQAVLIQNLLDGDQAQPNPFQGEPYFQMVIAAGRVLEA